MWRILAVGILLAGCVAPRQEHPGPEIRRFEAAVQDYKACLSETVAPFYGLDEDPSVIAEAVVGACEGRLAAYKVAVSDYLRANTRDGSRTQYEVLMIEPDRRTAALRDKGRALVIASLLKSRLP